MSLIGCAHPWTIHGTIDWLMPGHKVHPGSRYGILPSNTWTTESRNQNPHGGRVKVQDSLEGSLGTKPDFSRSHRQLGIRGRTASWPWLRPTLASVRVPFLSRSFESILNISDKTLCWDPETALICDLEDRSCALDSSTTQGLTHRDGLVIPRTWSASCSSLPGQITASVQVHAQKSLSEWITSSHRLWASQ